MRCLKFLVVAGAAGSSSFDDDAIEWVRVLSGNGSNDTAATTAAPSGNETTTAAASGNETTTAAASGNETTTAAASGNETTTAAPSTTTAAPASNANETTAASSSSEETTAASSSSEEKTTVEATGSATEGATQAPREKFAKNPNDTDTETTDVDTKLSANMACNDINAGVGMDCADSSAPAAASEPAAASANSTARQLTVDAKSIQAMNTYCGAFSITAVYTVCRAMQKGNQIPDDATEAASVGAFNTQAGAQWVFPDFGSCLVDYAKQVAADAGKNYGDCFSDAVHGACLYNHNDDASVNVVPKHWGCTKATKDGAEVKYSTISKLSLPAAKASDVQAAATTAVAESAAVVETMKTMLVVAAAQILTDDPSTTLDFSKAFGVDKTTVTNIQAALQQGAGINVEAVLMDKANKEVHAEKVAAGTATGAYVSAQPAAITTAIASVESAKANITAPTSLVSGDAGGAAATTDAAGISSLTGLAIASVAALMMV